MGKYLAEFTKKEAESLGLLVCKCGWPKTGHFDFGKKENAHAYCRGYHEKVTIGKLIIKKKERKNEFYKSLF